MPRPEQRQPHARLPRPPLELVVPCTTTPEGVHCRVDPINHIVPSLQGAQRGGVWLLLQPKEHHHRSTTSSYSSRCHTRELRCSYEPHAWVVPTCNLELYLSGVSSYATSPPALEPLM